jgi:hypothetical protein
MSESDQLQTHRDTLLAAAPRWLRGFYGSRLLYSIGLTFDALADAASIALKLGMPGLYSYSTLRLLGEQRKLPRGYNELDVDYAADLQQWLDWAPIAGTAYALLLQIWRVIPNQYCQIITNDGHTYELVDNALLLTGESGALLVGESGALLTGSVGDMSPLGHGIPNVDVSVGSVSWNWDGNTAASSRFWIILDGNKDYLPPTVTDWRPPAVSGGGWVCGNGHTCGSTATRDRVRLIQEVVWNYTPEASSCENIITVFDWDGWNANQPDGTWNLLSHRFTGACYWPSLR